jgi:hypothetical protein
MTQFNFHIIREHALYPIIIWTVLNSNCVELFSVMKVVSCQPMNRIRICLTKILSIFPYRKIVSGGEIFSFMVN